MAANIINFEINDFETENISPERNLKQLDFRPSFSAAHVADLEFVGDATPKTNDNLLNRN
jgi:hypothetical protein